VTVRKVSAGSRHADVSGLKRCSCDSRRSQYGRLRRRVGSSRGIRCFAVRGARGNAVGDVVEGGSTASPPLQLGNDARRPWTSPGTLTSDSRFLCAVQKVVACRPFMFCTFFVCATSLFSLCAYTYKKIM